MKKISYLILIAFSISCGNKNTELAMVKYYPISVIELISNFEKSNNLPDSVYKIVMQTNTIEHKMVSKSFALDDIKSFEEFDINKAAWQKSYISIKHQNYTRFQCIEQKLSLKYIDVYGDVNNPTMLRFYFLNANNLYTSSKTIQWIPSKSYSIYSIQDVKGLNADTLFVKSSW
jgi:patatin-like phospholipase/acyl hydrolase